eukprot:4645469-Pyramimonas_sp.AAC.1
MGRRGVGSGTRAVAAGGKGARLCQCATGQSAVFLRPRRLTCSAPAGSVLRVRAAPPEGSWVVPRCGR